MIVLDWDRKTEWAAYDGTTLTHFPKSGFHDFLNSLPSGTVLYVESAHFQPRTPLSVAQVYNVYELSVISHVAYKRGIDVYLFPEILTFRARAEVGLAKDDDTKAIYKFIHLHPEVSLKSWYVTDDTDEARWSYLNGIRDDCTVRLNIMRPDYDSPELDHARKLLEDNFDKLPESARKIFEITKKKKLLFNKSRVMSVYVICFDKSGELRTNSRGNFIGLRTVWAVLKMHPYHRKAGTARSNLMYHCLRNLEHKDPRADSTVRPEFRRAIKDLVKFFRDVS